MRVVIHGIVQGVGFRPTVHRIAREMGLNGFVQNNGSNVVVCMDGDPDEFLRRLRDGLPRLARIDRVEVDDVDVPDPYSTGFSIVPSESGERGVGIPTDTAVCDSCLEEMFDPSDRRYLYPFTTCTDCGARFTLIEDLPYDRERTSMSPFQRCGDCEAEYVDIEHRRFHHQTVTCPACGPSYRLLDGCGELIAGDPIAGFARVLEDGGIGIAKSWGGMHICATLDSVPALRSWYGRERKPFAIMVRDLEALRRYADASVEEVSELASRHRPIVIVDKASPLEGVSPNLGNVGVFLPYAGMHHLLFHHLDEDAIVMTSANRPGEPMMLRDEDVASMGVDAYLLHDRRIVNRADDSVLRMVGPRRSFIRKSRGHTPSSMRIHGDGRVLGVGAMENLTASMSDAGMVYSTQHIGDGDRIGVIDFLDDSIAFLRRLVGLDSIDAVCMDLHPGYTNRALARRIAEEEGAELFVAQHHWSHVASLMVDSGEDEMVALALDGTGYGSDGNAWGGEVLHCDSTSFDRVGHLQGVPLLGGEAAVRDPRRLVFAFMESAGTRCELFGERESEVFRRMMSRSVLTTSMGRLLDAISCATGTCCERSYDGEPAMRLEPLLEDGIDVLGMEAEVEGGEVKTVPLMEELMGSSGRPCDLAVSVVGAALRGLVDIAADRAIEAGLDRVGLTGGVSYNRPMVRMAESMISDRGLGLVTHNDVPNGDGGISVGQCAIALGHLSGNGKY